MILDLIGYIIYAVLWCLWSVIYIFWPVIVIGSLVAIPLIALSKTEGPWYRMEKPIGHKYRLTPQESSVYYNSFGHLVKIDPVEGSEDKIRQYFRDLHIDETNFREDIQ